MPSSPQPIIFNQGSLLILMLHILILGGTTEASELASTLSNYKIKITFSYAGRVEAPKEQPANVRVGGFGGIEGLRDYLIQNHVTHLIDATHPFAQKISVNAIHAVQKTGVKFITLTRAPWEPKANDRWLPVPDITAAVAAVSTPPQRIMLAIGRIHIDSFIVQPQHNYLLRLIDEPMSPPSLPNHTIVIERGPFNIESDMRLLNKHKIELIICKNSGGKGADAKLIAARELGLPVIMIDRPKFPIHKEVHSVSEILQWLTYDMDLGV